MTSLSWLSNKQVGNKHTERNRYIDRKIVILVGRIFFLEKNKQACSSIRDIRVRRLLTMSIENKMPNNLTFSVILQFLADFFEIKIPLDFWTKLKNFGHSETVKNVSHSS